MWVFADNCDSMRNIFGHEFAHILGLRHYDAGSNPKELVDPSALWLGTRDGNCDTIMRTGVHSSELRLFWSSESFTRKELERWWVVFESSMLTRTRGSGISYSRRSVFSIVSSALGGDKCIIDFLSL
ncbi:hypothetical protein LA080_004733 [Diaporthe eres]|nr:hypothetical protein LA080_004733 [Diaporthe eres]